MLANFPEFDDNLLDSGSFFQRKAAEMIAAEQVKAVRTAVRKAAVPVVRPFASVSRRGGLLFFRVWRFGGSFYFAKACVAAVCVSLSLAACSPDEPKQPPQTKVFHRVAGDPQELVIRGGRWVPQREVTNSGVTILRGR